MKLVFSGFMGMAPKYDPTQLPDGYAEESKNTRSGRGMLESWYAPKELPITNCSATRALMPYVTKWFSFNKETYVEKAQLKNDPYDFAIVASPFHEPRLVYNLTAEQGTGPWPAVTYKLNVPTPPDVLDVSVGDAPYWFVEPDPEEIDASEPPPIDRVIGLKPAEGVEEVEYDKAEVQYAYCYVDAMGRLSQLSNPSQAVEIREWRYLNTTESLIKFPAPHADLMQTDPNTGRVARIRIYRTNQSASGAAVFQFVDEIAIAETEYRDTKYSGDLLDAPLNADWLGAPDMDSEKFPNGPMSKIVVMGTDILAGHNKKVVCFAEPGAFYAWPVSYYKVFKENVVTIQSAGSNLVVLTDGFPYVISGVHPASMDASRLSDPVPCASSRGVTEVVGAVYFAAKTGLYRIDDTRISNVSLGFMTEREWRSFYPESMIFTTYDDKVFIRCPIVNKTLVFDALEPTAGIRELDLDAACFSQVESNNQLVYVDKQTNNVMEFDAETTAKLALSWKSKVYEFNDPVCFTIVKAKASRYPFNLAVQYWNADGSGLTMYNKTVTDSHFFYLPFNALAHKWQVSVGAVSEAAPVEVHEIQLVQSPEELT